MSYSPTLPEDEFSPSFSVVIPVYNEEQGVGGTLQQLQADLSQCPFPYEIIVVNDGSTDRTSSVLTAFSNIRIIEHRRNRGYGAALKTGIRQAKYPLIVITDGDGTYPNDRIPDLIRLMANHDMVVGARIGEDVTYPLIRKIPKWFLIRFAEWVADSSIPDLNSGLRVFRKSVAEKFFGILPDTFSFTTTITLAMLTNNYLVHYEPINYRARKGRSKIKPIRDTIRFWMLITRTSIYFAPMRIIMPVSGVFFLGFCFTIIQDIFVREDLTERSLILLIAATQTAIFALLADMIDKRSGTR